MIINELNKIINVLKIEIPLKIFDVYNANLALWCEQWLNCPTSTNPSDLLSVTFSPNKSEKCSFSLHGQESVHKSVDQNKFGKFMFQKKKTHKQVLDLYLEIWLRGCDYCMNYNEMCCVSRYLRLHLNYRPHYVILSYMKFKWIRNFQILLCMGQNLKQDIWPFYCPPPVSEREPNSKSHYHFQLCKYNR